jgi:hypothetical protein
MTARWLFLGIGALAVVATTACGNPFETNADLETIEDTLAVYGLSDAPPILPTAFTLVDALAGGPRVVRTDPSQNYDVVFDIRPGENGDPAIFVLPPRAVGQLGATATGVLKDTTHTYDAITQAPTSGYNDSTAVQVKPGDVVLVQAQAAACSGQLLTSRLFLYAKLVIDSANVTPYDPFTNPAGNTIYFRTRVDPNCGFISFADGIPRF